MNRNFFHINHYLNRLLVDDYGQEPDDGHTQMMAEVFDKWIINMTSCTSVLDIGCGAIAVAEPFFKARGIEYTGIALAKDAVKANALGKNVTIMDMSFLEFGEKRFDMVWARHSLEHSPMPLLTLMEFERVAKYWLCLILPKPDHFGRVGLNHYSVLYEDQWLFLADRAGWRPMWEDHSHPQEYRFMMEKK